MSKSAWGREAQNLESPTRQGEVHTLPSPWQEYPSKQTQTLFLLTVLYHSKSGETPLAL